MQKVYYYVGANNDTKELEKSKIENILSKSFDGFTAYEVVGYWKGNKERTLKIEIIDERPASDLAKVAKRLKKGLNQESILMEIVQSNCAFI